MKIFARIALLTFLYLNMAYADPDLDLSLAITNNNNEALVQAIKEGADVNLNDQFGNPPLYLAALRQNTDAIRILVRFGADVNQPNRGGQTALHVAAANGYGNVVDVLLELGADLQLGDNEGVIPGELATRNHQDALARRMVQMPHRNLHRLQRSNGFSIGSFIGGAAVAAVVFVFAFKGGNSVEN